MAGCAEPSNSGDQNAEEEVLIASGDDRLPNRTAADWVTYADHVVLVTVTREHEMPPSQTEIERGEGIVLRDLTLTVDQVLWSNPKPAKPAPDTFQWTAHGWSFEGTDPTTNRVKMTGDDQPRMELEQRYVMAIEWEEPRCTDGDRVPGEWRGLGSDSTIPFDGELLGQGEYMGEFVSATDRLKDLPADNPDFSLEDQVTGKTKAALVSSLERATPEKKEQYGPPPAPCL
jgi:hypothetical protein